MALIISLGSNLGNKTQNLNEAKKRLSKSYKIKGTSRIFASEPVDYFDQPSFYNQVLEFETPNEAPEKIMAALLQIESEMGRSRNIPKGPRVIDIDILFIDFLKISSKALEVPHPRLFERPFCTIPLKELPFFENLKKHYDFPRHSPGKACFPVEARP
jgi:2-amino-4-hydroxy-6-hydroxymethyldihydropteridine diphosphokinase